jgi:hypothetical protein
MVRCTQPVAHTPLPSVPATCVHAPAGSLLAFAPLPQSHAACLPVGPTGLQAYVTAFKPYINQNATLSIHEIGVCRRCLPVRLRGQGGLSCFGAEAPRKSLLKTAAGLLKQLLEATQP